MSRREADSQLSAPLLFAGPGPCRAVAREVDWIDTPLGAVGGWPFDLVCAARTVLLAPAPMLLWWGDDFHQFHNDALLHVLGDGQPAIGRPAKVAWPERWDVLGPTARRVRSEGEDVRLDDLELPSGDGTVAHLSVAMGPVVDASGGPSGVLASVVDLSDRVAERRQAQDINDNLQFALASNRRIGTAIGILMAQRRITDAAAFELLRAASQTSHRKLREIADDVVLTGCLPGEG